MVILNRIRVVVSVLTFLCSVGIASQYSDGVMESVVLVRQAGRTAFNLPKELPAVDSYVAVVDCAEIGQTYEIHYRERIETFLVADCSGSRATTA